MTGLLHFPLCHHSPPFLNLLSDLALCRLSEYSHALWVERVFGFFGGCPTLMIIHQEDRHPWGWDHGSLTAVQWQEGLSNVRQEAEVDWRQSSVQAGLVQPVAMTGLF